MKRPPLTKININERKIKEQIRTHKFGQIRPQVRIDLEGRRLIPVGKTLYSTNSECRFFPDFLLNFVPLLFGREWWKSESRKPEGVQHQACLWRAKAWEYRERHPKNDNGVFSMKPNGFMAAYLNLAYDLYVVADNSVLSDRTLARLKHVDQFQGARHELFAEATCLRAGFQVTHEDEKDSLTRHVEFTATHKATSQKISVEAKSRHRRGVLGFSGFSKSSQKIKLDFSSLVRKAARKSPPYPLVIFLDTNLPPETADEVFPIAITGKEGTSRLIDELGDEIRRENGGRDPFVAIIYTNHPHHYGNEDEPDPRKQLLFAMSTLPSNPADAAALWSLEEAADKYGVIPNDFSDLTVAVR